MTRLDDLSRRHLLVLSGKGGVGKSTVAAALGQVLSARGRRVLLLETDPRESLAPLLDLDPSGGAVLDAGGGLFVQNLQPQAVVDRLVRRRLRLGLIARRVLSSAVYRQFTAGAPGLRELATLGYALEVVRGEVDDAPSDVNLVLLDAPATGHGISLLAAPALVAGAIEGGPVAELSGEVARLVADAERTAVVLVTLAEEMPTQEALEMIDGLEARVGRPPELLVVNGLYPPPDAGAPPDDADPALRLWHERRAVNERELARIDKRWAGPRVELPLLPLERGARLTAALAGRLAEALDTEDRS